MPARFEFIRDPGYLSDVVRYRDQITPEPGEHGQIPCGRQIGAQQSTIANLQLNSQQGVQYFYFGVLWRPKLVLPRSLSTYLVSVDREDRLVGELLGYFGRDIFSFHRPNTARKLVAN